MSVKMEIVHNIMTEVFEEEKKGAYEKGIYILENAMENFPEYYEDLLYELSLLYFRQEFYYVALIGLIEVFRITVSEDVYQFIIQAYVLPNEKELKDNYEHNLLLTEKYTYFYNDNMPEDYYNIDTIFVWMDSEHIIYCKDKEFIEVSNSLNNLDDLKQQTIIISNIMSKERIIDYIKINIGERNEKPIYLYYTAEKWIIMMQMIRLDELFQIEYLVFLIGLEKIKEFFKEKQALLPEIMVGEQELLVGESINEILKEKIEHLKKVKNVLEEDPSINEKILHNIKSKKPRIMFLTSRKTTALQYHAKNIKEAAEKLNIKTNFLIEKSDIHYIRKDYLADEILRFKPDIIFLLDHFRFCMDINLDSYVFITWIQDPLPDIMNKSTPAKLSSRDIILNHFISWNKFNEIGYDKSRIIDAPIPANSDIYKPYNLLEEEKLKYSCDICILCHGADVMEWVDSFSSDYGELKNVVVDICMKYYHMVLDEGKIIYSENEMREFIIDVFLNTYGIHIVEKSEEFLERFLTNFFTYFNQRVYRHALINWIIDAGFTNIKLWGNGWLTEDKYAPFAMGIAENGETLSKIYQSSKIVIGNNIMTTAAARAWESMLSGAFYMSNYIPPEDDISDIRKILDEEDFVMFYDKEDLIEKIHYYLNHEVERQKMIQKGRKKALEKMTFVSLMQKILDKLPELIN